MAYARTLLLKFRLFQLLLIGIFVAATCNGSEINQINYLNKSGIVTNATINVNDNLLFAEEQAAPTSYAALRRTQVRLSYNREGRTDVASGSAWTYTVPYTIYKTGFESTISESGSITVNYTPGSTNNIYEAVNKHFISITAGYPDVTLRITGTPTITGTPPADIRLEVVEVTERYTNIAISPVPSISYNSTLAELSWDFIPGAEEYDVEWTFIDYLDTHSSFVSDEDAFNYKTPVRITTPNQFYNIDQIYPKGTLYFRVRGVGRHIAGVSGDYTHISYGDWGYRINSLAPALTYVISGSYQTNQNWNYSAAFAESGKFKKGIGYTDGTGKLRQSQASMNSDGTVIVGENKYDIEGRPVLSIMPSPVIPTTATSAFDYKGLFNKDAAGGEYEHTDFELGPTPTALGDQSGTGKYYSSSNSFQSSDAFAKNTADGGGFPFTQIEYKRDNTGRISKTTAGAGATYQFGNSHELKYFYGTTSGTELHWMFGTNVGEASHYKKNMAQDANGQVSISYLDQENRVIATALAGTAPANLLPLESNNSCPSMIESLNHNNVIDRSNDISTSISHIQSVTPSDYVFTYDMAGVIYGTNIGVDGLGFYQGGEPEYDSCKIYQSVPICADCKYVLSVKVSDPDGLVVQIPDPTNGGALVDELIVPFTNPDNPNCANNSYQKDALSFTINFNKLGDYTVSKVLTIDTTGIWIKINAAIAAAGFDQDYIDELRACYISHTDLSQCDVTCEEHCKSIVHEANPTWLETDEDFITAVNTCMDVNCSAQITTDVTAAAGTECDDMMEQMMADVSPAGFEYLGVVDVNFWSNAATKFSNYTLPSGEPTTGDLENDNYIILLDNNGLLLNPQPTITELQDPATWLTLSANPHQWARQLAKVHREYCHYQSCVLNSVSNTYDVLMSQVADWDAANALGYLDPAGFGRTSSIVSFPSGVGASGPDVTVATVTAGIDPLFITQSSVGGSIYDEIKLRLLTDFSYNGYTDIWHYVNDPTSPPYNTSTGAGLSFTNANMWIVFRGLYLNAQAAAKVAAADEANKLGTCPYYTDAYSIELGTPTLTGTPAEITATFNQVNDCAERSTLNAALWMEQLEHYLDSAGCVNAALSTDDLNEIKYNLMLYSQEVCGVTNPGGLITDAAIASPDTYLNKVMNILNTHITSTGNCTSTAILSYISSGEPYTVDCATDNARDVTATLPNQCFEKLVTYINTSVLPVTLPNCFSLSTAPDSLQGGCLGGTNLYVNGTDLKISTVGGCSSTNCQTLRFYGADGNAISFDVMTEIGEPVYATVSPILVSPFGLFKNLRCIVNTPSGPITAYLYELAPSCAKISLTKGENLSSFCTAQINVDNNSSNVYPGTMGDLHTSCVSLLLSADTASAISYYNRLVQRFTANYISAHFNNCFSNHLTEEFHYEHNRCEYHYTLYYYDQAGNLTQTVPPEGFHPVVPAGFDGTTGEYNSLYEPQHTYLTRYTYNSLNQVVSQQTPDGGLTHYYYDDEGRLRFSQNAKQVASNAYSYTIYDALSRISQVGESTQLYTGSTAFYNGVNDQAFPNDNRSQVTKTNYDAPTSIAPTSRFASGNGQQFQRTRVTSTELYENTYDGTTANLTYATYYSYDEHGNVNELVQDNKLLASIGTDNEYKYLHYNYELVSGNVKDVAYQPGKPDEFYHRYTYDADNRLTIAQTSNNGVIWEKDAKYFYYKHGPLARTETGEDKVQGTDYAYTINGWMKGINSTSMYAANDMAKDANLNGTAMDASNNNNLVATDALGYTLGYYDNDYSAVGGSPAQTWLAVTAGTPLSAAANPNRNLYNGNIAHTTSIFLDNSEVAVKLMGKAYKYDQLNRLRNVNNFFSTSGTDLPRVNNNFTSSVDNGSYNEDFTYDANGNIKTANRWGSSGSVKMDEFAYKYETHDMFSTYADYTNKLRFVTDASAACNFTDDIDDQGASVGNENYGYDPIGNLVSDKAEGIATIEWNVYGKIKSITRETDFSKDVCGVTVYPSNLEFKYDASGNRICKIVKPRNSSGQQNEEFWVYTYYNRDAQGNVMAINERQFTITGGDYLTEKIVLKEHHLYGSSHLGTENKSINLGGIAFGFSSLTHNADGTIVVPGTGVSIVSADAIGSPIRTVGDKLYELSNHLGNVMVVVSDKKQGVSTSGSSTDAEYYLPDVVSAQDYYAFGALISGRSFNASAYKYGANAGSERDDEITDVIGAHSTAEYWEYDARLGRRWNIDPIVKPWESSYAAFGDNPVFYNDPNGLNKKDPNNKYDDDGDGVSGPNEGCGKGSPEGNYWGRKQPQSVLPSVNGIVGPWSKAAVNQEMVRRAEVEYEEATKKSNADYLRSSLKISMKMAQVEQARIELLDAVDFTSDVNPVTAPAKAIYGWWNGKSYVNGKKYTKTDQAVNTLAVLPLLSALRTEIRVYKSAQLLTAGYKGAIQAHHLVEVRMLKQLNISKMIGPSQVLTREVHNAVTQALLEAMPKGYEIKSVDELIDIYKQVYNELGHPEWGEAVESFLKTGVW